jgi:hypothetical protein
MKRSDRTRLLRFLLIVGIAAALVLGNYLLRSAPALAYPHLAAASCKGETIYIDSIKSQIVLDREPNPPTGHLISFLIGWKDNIPPDDELSIGERNIYFHRHMPQDWTVLAHGDSIHAVYFRERPVLNRHFHQGALVFPTPPGCCVDTLVYTGAAGPWQQQIFILKRK